MGETARASPRAPREQHHRGLGSRAAVANRTSLCVGHAARVVRAIVAGPPPAAAPAGAHDAATGDGDSTRRGVRAAHGARRLRVQPAAHAQAGRAAPSAAAARHHTRAQVPRGARPLTRGPRRGAATLFVPVHAKQTLYEVSLSVEFAIGKLVYIKTFCN